MVKILLVAISALALTLRCGSSSNSNETSEESIDEGKNKSDDQQKATDTAPIATTSGTTNSNDSYTGVVVKGQPCRNQFKFGTCRRIQSTNALSSRDDFISLNGSFAIVWEKKRDGETVLGHRYTLSTEQWQEISPLGAPAFPQIESLNTFSDWKFNRLVTPFGKAFATYGYARIPNSPNWESRIYTYDPEKDLWSIQPKFNGYSNSIISFQNKLTVIDPPKLHRLEGSSWNTISMDGSFSSSTTGRLFAQSQFIFNLVDHSIYHNKTNNYVNLQPSSAIRTRIALTYTTSPTKVIYWGGANQNMTTFFNDGAIYDIEARSWAAIPAAPTSGGPTPRIYAFGFATAHHFYIAGGYVPIANTNRQIPSKEIWRYSFADNKWSAVTVESSDLCSADESDFDWDGTNFISFNSYCGGVVYTPER